MLKLLNLKDSFNVITIIIISRFLLGYGLGNHTAVLDACSYLERQDSQMNAYIGPNDFLCCMCPIGTRLVKDCLSKDLPDTTICEPCENNAKIKLFIDFGPHTQRHCMIDTVHCTYPFVYIEGSASKKSRCECAKGYETQVLLKQVMCKKLPTPSITVPSLKQTSENRAKPYEERIVGSVETTAILTTTPVVESTEKDNINKSDADQPNDIVTHDEQPHKGDVLRSTAFSKTTGPNNLGTSKTDNIPVWAFVVFGIASIITIIIFLYKCRDRLKRCLQRKSVSDAEKVAMNNLMDAEVDAPVQQPPPTYAPTENATVDDMATTEPTEEDKLLSQENDTDDLRTGLKIKNETKSVMKCDDVPSSVCGRTVEKRNETKNKAGPIYTSDDMKPVGRRERVGDDGSQCGGNQGTDQQEKSDISNTEGTSTLGQETDDQSVIESQEIIEETASPKNEVSPIVNGDNNPPGVQRVLSVATGDASTNQGSVSAQLIDTGQSGASLNQDHTSTLQNGTGQVGAPSDHGHVFDQQNNTGDSRPSGQANRQAAAPAQTQPATPRPSELHKRKRDEAAKAISRCITKKDCRVIGHFLISSDNELDHLMKKFENDHEETAWQVFRRGFQLDPNVSLYKLRDFVDSRGLGYLREKFQDKISELEDEQRDTDQF